MAEYLQAVAPDSSAPLAQDVIADVLASLSSGKYRYFIKIDIVNFYPTLSHEWVRASLTRKIASPPIVDLFMRAIEQSAAPEGRKADSTSTSGVPQGLAISNGIAELSLAHLDSSLRKRDGLAYFRFVDDILILLPRRSTNKLVMDIKQLMALAGVKIHPVKLGANKSSVGRIADSFEYLGYKFVWPRVTVRSGSVSRIEGRLARAFTGYKYARQRAGGDAARVEVAKRRLQWHVDLVVTGCRFDGHAVGWLVYFSQIRHQQLLAHLDWLIEDRSNRFAVTDVQFKSFTKAYRLLASRHGDITGYIPNFDAWVVDDKRQCLMNVFGVSAARLTNDLDVDRIFAARVRREVRDLEQDTEGAGYN
jgi:hypothetical protein